MTPDPTIGIPLRYRDRFGAEQSLLHNDGCDMSMTLRGVEFHGQFIDNFEPVGLPPEGVLTRFALAGRQLCGYTLEFQIPLAMVNAQAFLSAGKLRSSSSGTKTLGRFQETWVCDGWEPRTAGRGYRG